MVHKNRVGVTTSLEHCHKEVLKKSQQLLQFLVNLRYEGKVSLGRNIKSIAEILKFFQKTLLPHMDLDERILFPFVATHIPRLSPAIKIFKIDHREFKSNLRSFIVLFEQLKNAKTENRRFEIIEQLKEKGTYLMCLLRHHVRAESEQIHKAADEDLHLVEKNFILREIKKVCKKHDPLRN
ncbi:MAG: hemerythrin domain-containing protein [Candidatus Omnitrophota bacterium]